MMGITGGKLLGLNWMPLSSFFILCLLDWVVCSVLHRYNPVLWGVPKGSYASNPNGPYRIIEFRKMIQVQIVCILFILIFVLCRIDIWVLHMSAISLSSFLLLCSSSRSTFIIGT